MMPYCSSTGTRTTREQLLKRGWSVLWCATGHNWDSKPTIPSYAIDNGAWSAFLQNKPFSSELFLRCLEFSKQNPQLGKPNFTVLPDVVKGGLASLDFSLSWEKRVRPYSARVLIAVQDGMRPKDVEQYLDESTGLFIGGSTEWKLATLDSWGALCRDKYYLHCGRVNTKRRINHCLSAGVDSFDGTSVARFPKTIKQLDRARHQMALPLF